MTRALIRWRRAVPFALLLGGIVVGLGGCLFVPVGGGPGYYGGGPGYYGPRGPVVAVPAPPVVVVRPGYYHRWWY